MRAMHGCVRCALILAGVTVPSVGAVAAAALCPFTATDEKTRKVFSILVVISLVGTISGKSLNG